MLKTIILSCWKLIENSTYGLLKHCIVKKTIKEQSEMICFHRKHISVAYCTLDGILLYKSDTNLVLCWRGIGM